MAFHAVVDCPGQCFEFTMLQVFRMAELLARLGLYNPPYPAHACSPTLTLRCGNTRAGMLVAQATSSFHWNYAGRPRAPAVAIATYNYCSRPVYIDIKLLQAKPTDNSYVRLLGPAKDLATVHGWAKVRECCHRGAMQQSRGSYS